MEKKTSKILMTMVFLIAALYMVSILFILLFFSYISYSCRKTFLVNNIILLPISLGIIFLLIFVLKHFCKGKITASNDLNWLATMFLFFIQVFISYNICFRSLSWDSATIIDNAKLIAGGGNAENLSNFYFSSFPTNQFLVFFTSLLFKINNFTKAFPSNDGLFSVIFFQCFINALTGKMVFDIVHGHIVSNNSSDISDHDEQRALAAAWLAWLLYVILVGLSGWNVVIYTDAMGLFFPTAILRVYQKLKLEMNERKRLVYWILLTFFSYFGFRMKPSALIVTIAIIIVKGINFIESIAKEKLWKLGKVVVIVYVTLMICHASFLWRSIPLGFVLMLKQTRVPFIWL